MVVGVTESLVAFLTARLDEVAAAAKAATPGPWVVGHLAASAGNNYGSHLAAMGTEKRMLLTMSTGYHPSKHVATAEHIANHDPAQVLRDIEAKRAILADHASGGRPPTCQRCKVAGALGPEPYLAPCLTVRLLCAVYSDHPDYNRDWA